MDKRHFHQLLTRYRSGECTEREARLVDQWFALIDGDRADLTDRQSEETEAKLWQAIRTRTGHETSYQPEKPKSLHVFFKWRWVAAAVLVLVAWGGYQWGRANRKGSSEQLAGHATKNLVSRANATNAPMWVSLPDGSRLSLQPRSTIGYPAHFGHSKREVYLNGKAFFEVKRDEQKPFVVYTGEITTKVLGTSFWVNSTPADHAVEVSVVTGKVSVFQKDKEKETGGGVTLTRNQRVRYSPGSKVFTATLVPRPMLDDYYKDTFVFDDARLGHVAETLEKAYGIDIVLTNDKLKNCLFTADINKQPMFTQLDLIAAAVNATYTIKGTKIYLSGKGCP